MTSKSTQEAKALLQKINERQGGPLTFMEVCGTHTMSAARFGLRHLLPQNIRLISGPGCPVCVTPVGYVDHALALAEISNVTITTFGDMMRVPGSRLSATAPPRNLTAARAQGADVRVVYSPLDALDFARAHQDRKVVFLGVGFETTTPVLAASLLQAQKEGLNNYFMLAAPKTIPGPMEILATSGEVGIDGFLCPGHVSIILGTEVYRPLAENLSIPCAIAGFEMPEILRGIVSLMEQVDNKTPKVDNCYPGAVRPEGNPKARAQVAEVFEPCDATWRGLGPLPQSGLCLNKAFASLDASKVFKVSLPEPVEPKGCRCGDVLRGVLDPADCALFGKACTPEDPQGACMVSSEGSCAARYAYSEQ